MQTSRLRLLRLFPFLAWPAQWSAASLRADLLAGLGVALVMVPQSLAYTQLAGMPPHIGLYAALLPTVVGALFGSCAQLSTGPVALSSMLTAAALSAYAAPGTPDFIELAVALSVLAGLIQLLLGGLRLGWLLNLLSLPVLRGFTNAAALLICLSQLPPLLGLHLGHSDNFLLDLWRALAHAPGMPLAAPAFGLGSLATLLILQRVAPRLPAVPLVVLGATLISSWSGFAEGGGPVVGKIPAGLPALHWPELPLQHLAALMPAAFVIALVSFMEAASSARTISGRTRAPWDQNQELLGQGLAKLAGAASGTQPVSVSFSRSALNYGAGAKSGMASIFGTAIVVVVLLFFTPWLYHLPVAVLAAVIVLAVGKLIDPTPVLEAWRVNRDDGIGALVAFVATLAFAPNIQNGILTGLLLSLALMVYRSMNPRVAQLGPHPDGTWRDARRFQLAPCHPEVVILRFDGPLQFVTAATFADAVLEAAESRPDIRYLLISAGGINAVDATGLEALEEVRTRLQARGQTLALCGLKQQVLVVMERSRLWPVLAPHSGYRSEEQALAALAPAPSAPPHPQP